MFLYRGTPSLEDFSPGRVNIQIEQLKQNEILWLDQVLCVKDIVSGSISDKTFTIQGKRGNKEFVDFPFSLLYKFIELINLRVSGYELTDIGFLKDCSNLKTLNIEFCQVLEDLSILKKLTNIEEVRIFRCPKIDTKTLKDISFKLFVEKEEEDLIEKLTVDKIPFYVIEKDLFIKLKL